MKRKKNCAIYLPILAAVAFASAAFAAPKTIYVDKNVASSGDGTSAVVDLNAPDSTPLFGISRQTLIAHRGHVALSTTVAQPPENTLASIDEAVAEGFGFECDVLYTKDGRVFTMHDGCFKRVYDIDSEDYASMTWDYVSHLVPIDCSGRRHPETRAALFEEVCGRARDGRWCFVELKTGGEIVPLIKKVLRSQDVANPGNLAFISFSQDAIRALKRELPEYKAMLLMYSRHAWPSQTDRPDHSPYTAEQCLEALAACGADGLDFHFNGTIPEHGPDFVKRIKSAGYEFHVWVVDDFALVRQAFANGAQTVTTNHAKAILERARFAAACHISCDSKGKETNHDR